MKRKKTKSKRFYKKISLKYYIPAIILLLVGIFYLTPVRGIVAHKLAVQGKYYFNGGAYDLEKSAKWYNLAAFVDDKSWIAHYELARIYFVKNDLKTALGEIDKALAVDPKNKRAYYIRGLIDGYAENYQASEDDFQKFIAWSPKEWAGYNDLAWAYYQNKDYPKAVDTALKGLEVAPDNPWLLNGLGVSYNALGEKEKGQAALEKVATLAKDMAVTDWQKAYPGNNPETAQWDLAQFRADVGANLNLASNAISSGLGKFTAACSASHGIIGLCQPDATCQWGFTCDIGDDPDHPDGFHHNPMCDYSTPGTCGADSHCYICGDGRCTAGEDCNICPGDCGACAPACGDHVCNGTETCSTCPGDCGACAVNHAPTVSIVNPTDGSTQDPNGTNFSINVQDQDNNTLTVTASTLSCTGSVNPLLNRTATNTSTLQNISATLGGLPAGASCTWNVTVSDGSLQTSANVSFQTQAAGPACSVSCSPSSIIIPPGGTANFTPTCSGSSCGSFTVNSCSLTSDTSGGKIHINKSGNACRITTDSNVSFTDKATANADTNCTACPADVNISIKRLWTETNP